MIISIVATQRRHVRAIGIRLSVRRRTNGKNTFFLGLSEDAQVDYGQDPRAQSYFGKKLRLAASVHRMRRISEVSGIVRNSLSLSHGDRSRLRVGRRVCSWMRNSGRGLHWMALPYLFEAFTSDSLAGFVNGAANLFSRALQSSQH